MLKRQKKLLGYQLKREDDVIRTLERQYRYALRAINEKIQMYQADEQTVSRIHHLNYQKRLKQQVEAELDKLHSNEYTTIQQYLDDAYTDGFVGTMYDLAGQGVPVIAPIDRNAAIKAVTTNSKLSTDLYNSLGVDLQTLKKSVRNEITRGIASGMLYSDIARNVATVTGSPLNRAKTIVRTEGHRIQEASRNDARMAAKAKGAETVKQWESTLDGETRPTHRQLDGQIREVDQPFMADGKEAMYPGDFGDPAEDCNCRCMALTRARKALMNPDELARMQERAAFFELDKTQDFEEFKAKYLKAAETVENPSGKTYNKGAIHGAYNDQNDPYGSKRDAHADRYYSALRNSKKSAIVDAIAANAGVDKKAVSNMYDHLLVNEYELDGGLKRFDTDYNIAQSLQRLREGKDIQPHDLILIQHEAMEYDLMNNHGMKYDEAHTESNKLYNYAKALKEFLIGKNGEE